jgi:hypothetical protein
VSNRFKAGLIDDIIYITTSEGTRRSRGMLIWNPWLDAVKFGFEVQNVMALRLLNIAAEGAGSSVDRTTMVTENVPAVADAQADEAVALAQGESIARADDAVALAQSESIKTATKPAMVPIKRRAHANHRRLKGK